MTIGLTFCQVLKALRWEWTFPGHAPFSECKTMKSGINCSYVCIAPPKLTNLPQHSSDFLEVALLVSGWVRIVAWDDLLVFSPFYYLYLSSGFISDPRGVFHAFLQKQSKDHFHKSWWDLGFKGEWSSITWPELTVLSACTIQLSQPIWLLNYQGQDEEYNVSRQTKTDAMSPAPSAESPLADRGHTDPIWIGFHYHQKGVGNPSLTQLLEPLGYLAYRLRTTARESWSGRNPSLPSPLTFAELLTYLKSIFVYTWNALNQPPLHQLASPTNPLHPFYKMWWLRTTSNRILLTPKLLSSNTLQTAHWNPWVDHENKLEGWARSYKNVKWKKSMHHML